MQIVTILADLILNTLLGAVALILACAVIDLVQFVTGRKYLLVELYDFLTEWEYQCRHDRTTLVESVIACGAAWSLCWVVLP